MQKVFWLLLLIHISSDAKSNISIQQLMIYKTNDNTLTISDIQKKRDLFQLFRDKDQISDENAHFWFKIELNETIESSRYMVSYIGYDFDDSSFKPSQLLNKYKFKNNQALTFSFYYDKNVDSNIYYFKATNLNRDIKPSISMQKYNDYYSNAIVKPDSKKLYLLFGLVAGIMFMVSVYNLSIYFYQKEISFVYYSLTQFSLIFIMMYDLGIIAIDMSLFYFLTLTASLFATLFMRNFFNMKLSLPRLNKILSIYLIIIFSDMIYLVLYGYSILSYYGLFSIFGIISILIGYLKLKQGFTPARFFLLGWGILLVSIFYTEHLGRIYGVSPLLISSPLEAIFIALALANKLGLILDEKKEQQELLVHQSKLAAIGEMIGNIAHQWKQPLTYLSYNFINLREAQKRNLLDTVYLNKKLDKADAQLEFMSQTIDNFKDFYLPNKEKSLFSVEQASRETLEIMEYQFQQHSIQIIMQVNKDIKLLSYKNEYKQILLNLLSNAKDVFLQRSISSPKITITIHENSISVLDNAGGIKEDILDDIFKPYFTTKEGNSGIGLYMSKMIIEKDMDALLKVENSQDGALFSIYFNQIKE